jgi:hypothetical protein
MTHLPYSFFFWQGFSPKATLKRFLQKENISKTPLKKLESKPEKSQEFTVWESKGKYANISS